MTDFSDKKQIFLAFDVGEKRIGVAQGDSQTKIPFPLATVNVDGMELDRIREIISEVVPDGLVVGFPRNQSGEKTAQTAVSLRFGAELEVFRVPVYFQDESLTSVAAEEYLKQTKKPYVKADIDARAAAIILDDFLKERYGY